MGEKARVIGMLLIDERVQDVARSIIDDVVEVQGVTSGLGLNRAGQAALRNIQVQARALLVGKPAPLPAATSEIAEDYRLDMLEVLQGLAEVMGCGQGWWAAGKNDEDLRLIALAAEVTSSRINNYLLVKRTENLTQRREAGNGLAQPAA